MQVRMTSIFGVYTWEPRMMVVVTLRLSLERGSGKVRGGLRASMGCSGWSCRHVTRMAFSFPPGSSRRRFFGETMGSGADVTDTIYSEDEGERMVTVMDGWAGVRVDGWCGISK